MQIAATLVLISMIIVTSSIVLGGLFRYEFQMQYGSIGWSVGATLGYAQAVPEKRVIACIGDGSFQVTKNREE